MNPKESFEWIVGHAEKPLLESAATRRYKHGLGLQIAVKEKKEFEDLYADPDFLSQFEFFVRRVGIVLLRTEDDAEFKLGLGEPAALEDGNYSLPFHVDIQLAVDAERGKLTGPDYLNHNYWADGIQGLYQNPQAEGRQADTLVAKVKDVRTAISNLPEKDREKFNKIADLLIDKRTPYSCKTTSLIQAWNFMTHPSFIRDEKNLKKIDEINKMIFASTKNLVRIPWSSPELSIGGAAMFWDAGKESSTTRTFVHARDNLKALTESDPRLYRI